MSVQVVSIANRMPDRAREGYYRPDVFLKSLERFGVAPAILGMNEPWGGLMTKARRLRKWLREGQCTADVLIWCDMFDIIFTVHPEEVAEAYLAGWPDLPMVCNAEKDLFPPGRVAHAFKDIPGPWKHLNFGFVVAPPDTMLKFLEAMYLDEIHDDHNATGDLDGGAGVRVNTMDQGWYLLMFAAQVVPMKLDHECRLCQTFSSCTIDEFDLSGERVRNVVKGTTPLVLHFNGGSKNLLMPIFFQKLGFE